jgi:hypothetical protein
MTILLCYLVFTILIVYYTQKDRKPDKSKSKDTNSGIMIITQ